MMFCIAQYNQFLWETLSIVSIMLFLTFWMVHRLSEQYYPMAKLLSFAFALIAAIAIWMKAEKVMLHYKEEGAIDVILLVGIVIILIDFITYLLRACNVRVTPMREQFAIYSCLGLVAVYAIGLFALGSEQHFAQLNEVMSLLLQPMWVVVIVLMIVHFARGEQPRLHSK